MQGLRWQVTENFIPHAGQKPAWAPWTADNSLFCIQVFLCVLTSNSHMDWYKRYGHRLPCSKATQKVI